MKAPSPYQLEQAMSVLLAARRHLLEDDPELQRDEQLLADILGSDPETCEPMDLIYRMIRASIHAKDMREAAHERAQATQARADRYQRRSDIFRATAFAALDALGTRKIEQPDFSVSVTPGKQVVVVTDEAALPDQYVRVTRAANKTELMEALRRGDVVPGAMLSNGTPSLRISGR